MANVKSSKSSCQAEDNSLVKNSALYKEYLAEREEILRHKWIESEKIGRDIGFERALLDWTMKHRSEWRARRIRDLRKPAQQTQHQSAEQ